MHSVRGFALPAVLWLLAGIAVVVAGISEAVKNASAINRQLRDRVSVAHAEQMAVADLSFLAGTHRAFGSGLQIADESLRLDGGRYGFKLNDREEFDIELQDLSGLMNVGEGDPVSLARLLTQCGVDQALATQMAEAAADYVDRDELKRINGAERADYVARGFVGPSNRRLNSLSEVKHILAWDQALKERKLDACLNHAYVGEALPLNLWMAPQPILVALGMSESEATSAIAEKKALSTQRLSSRLLEFFNLPQNRPGGFTRFSNLGGASVRVRLYHRHSRQIREFVWSRGSAGQLLPFTLTQSRWLADGSATADVAAPHSASLSSYIRLSTSASDKDNAPSATPFPR